MKTYKITVTRQLVETWIFHADSEQEAINKATIGSAERCRSKEGYEDDSSCEGDEIKISVSEI